MADVNEQTRDERRQKVAELWVSGLHSITKLAGNLGCDVRTIKRDLVALRKQARGVRKKFDIELLRLEIDKEYVELKRKLNEKIDDAAKLGNYNAVAGLIGQQIKLSAMRSELWNLIRREPSIHVSASATAGAVAYSSPVKNLKDQELDIITDNIIKRRQGISGS
ncbi:MAG: hypothetical protein WC486_00225 [Candidatus Omnitrophota bacterium]